MFPETVTRLTSAGRLRRGAWWDRYSTSLDDSGLSESARQVVFLDAQYILERCVLGAGEPGSPDSGWPETRIRRGLVVGSIQSGKTASMLGVAAMALDSGVDIVVLLTGTRIALWRQTVDRTLKQLDGWSIEVDPQRRLERVMLPSPRLVAHGRGSVSLQNLYHAQPNSVRRHLEKGRPLVALVMKQSDHLMSFGAFLRKTLGDWLPRADKPIHLLLIDDEADDGSILDAHVEAGYEPGSDLLKQIPRHIARIWSGRSAYDTTHHKNLYATYLAYTATPQANVLQSEHNPLSPSDFVVALRTPFDSGAIEPPRATTFREPEGLGKFYSGGEAFYSRLPVGPPGLCIAADFPKREEFDGTEEFVTEVEKQRLEMLADSLRAFFVASAMRLVESRCSLRRLHAMGPASFGDLQAAAPRPATMLVHPSASIRGQLRAADAIGLWSAEPLDRGHAELNPRPRLSPEGLALRLEQEPDLWKDWFESYQLTWVTLDDRFPGVDTSDASDLSWDDVREALLEEIFPYARLSVINSDPSADDRPRFDPVPTENGLYQPAPDLLTIFVSGNVMARGITLEGLTTTLFLRDSDSPAADTQMQMQRWFGYRGSYLQWCRVFLYSDQLDLFRAYHENDEALRREVIGEMNQLGGKAPSPVVLQGARFRATNKITNLRNLPLWPGPQPFVRVIDRDKYSSTNADVLADLLDSGEWYELSVGSTVRGLAREQQLSLLEVADVLDRFRYEAHNPDPVDPVNDRWRVLANALDLSPPVAPLFRPPDSAVPCVEGVSPRGCPYTIAAYLRLWSAALQRRPVGLYPTDDSQTPWSMINLSDYAVTAPKFNIGVRFGASDLADNSRLRAHGIRCMERQTRDSLVVATWGSRNPGVGDDAYLGDHLFDYHYSGFRPPIIGPNQTPCRPRGHPGLLLFHVLRIDDSEAVTVGVALPLGGPDQFAALRPIPRDSPVL